MAPKVDTKLAKNTTLAQASKNITTAPLHAQAPNAAMKEIDPTQVRSKKEQRAIAKLNKQRGELTDKNIKKEERKKAKEAKAAEKTVVAKDEQKRRDSHHELKLEAEQDNEEKVDDDGATNSKLAVEEIKDPKGVAVKVPKSADAISSEKSSGKLIELIDNAIVADAAISTPVKVVTEAAAGAQTNKDLAAIPSSVPISKAQVMSVIDTAVAAWVEEYDIVIGPKNVKASPTNIAHPSDPTIIPLKGDCTHGTCYGSGSVKHATPVKHFDPVTKTVYEIIVRVPGQHGYPGPHILRFLDETIEPDPPVVEPLDEMPAHSDCDPPAVQIEIGVSMTPVADAFVGPDIVVTVNDPVPVPAPPATHPIKATSAEPVRFKDYTYLGALTVHANKDSTSPRKYQQHANDGTVVKDIPTHGSDSAKSTSRSRHEAQAEPLRKSVDGSTVTYDLGAIGKYTYQFGEAALAASADITAALIDAACEKNDRVVDSMRVHGTIKTGIEKNQRPRSASMTALIGTDHHLDCKALIAELETDLLPLSIPKEHCAKDSGSLSDEEKVKGGQQIMAMLMAKTKNEQDTTTTVEKPISSPEFSDPAIVSCGKRSPELKISLAHDYDSNKVSDAMSDEDKIRGGQDIMNILRGNVQEAPVEKPLTVPFDIEAFAREKLQGPHNSKPNKSSIFNTPQITRPRKYCNHCHRPGHNDATCFKQYPELKPCNNRNMNYRGHSNSTTEAFTKAKAGSRRSPGSHSSKNSSGGSDRSGRRSTTPPTEISDTSAPVQQDGVKA